MVPNGWEIKKLRDVGVCLTGLTYKPENVVPDGLLVLRSSNVQDSQLSFDDNVYVNLEIPEKSRTRYGDVLLCVRNGSKRLIGKSAFITKDAEGLAHGAFMGLFRPKSNPEYIFQVFQTDEFYRQVHRNLGATINSINSGNLYEFKFAFPPAPEQQKIAKILTTWDKAIDTTERLIDNSKQQKKALMQQLLTGKKRLLDDNGKPFEGEWDEVKLSKAFTKITNGLTYDSKATTGLPVTRIETISTGFINYEKVGFAPDDERTRNFKLEEGDILYSHINSLKHIGRVAYYDGKYPLYHGMNLLLLRASERFSAKFMYYLLSSSVGKAFSQSRAKSAVNQASISTTDIKSYYVRTPPFKKQQKIASVLTNADKEIELLEQQLADLQQEKKALMQVLLTGKVRVRVD